MNLFDRDDIENRFGFHKGTIEGENATAPKHRDLRIAFMQFAEVLANALPAGRAKSLAFTELESASMWAHKAIAQTAPLVHEKGRVDWSNSAKEPPRTDRLTYTGQEKGSERMIIVRDSDGDLFGERS